MEAEVVAESPVLSQPEITTAQILDDPLLANAASRSLKSEVINENGPDDLEIPGYFHKSLLGIDFGCSKVVTSLIHHDSKFPFVVRNETQDLYTLNLLGFKGRQRLIGAEAMGEAQLRPQNCVEKLNLLLARPNGDASSEPFRHCSLPVTLLDALTDSTALSLAPAPSRLQLAYDAHQEPFYAEQLVAMVLNTIQQHCQAANQEAHEPVRDAFFLVAESVSQQHLYALNSAAALAHLNVLGFVPVSLALSMTYALKHGRHVSEEGQERCVMFVDMGDSALTLFLSKFTKEKGEVRASSIFCCSSHSQVLDVVSIPIGGSAFDARLFEHCRQFIIQKYQEDAATNWRYELEE
jgi:molecular chaperone DnaK (HSP70)